MSGDVIPSCYCVLRFQQDLTLFIGKDCPKRMIACSNGLERYLKRSSEQIRILRTEFLSHLGRS